MRMEIALPPSLGDGERERLLAAEADQAQQMRQRGTIVRIWRIPGRWANIGIWSCADATELHDRITSLPLAAHAEVQVTALAQHYLERDAAP